MECLLLKKESNIDFFVPFFTRISWYADTHLIICRTTKELQSMFGLCLSKMAIAVEMCLWHSLRYQLMCWWLRLICYLYFYNHSKSYFANAWACNSSHESLMILMILDEF
jgi:hypothetical protein